MPDYTHHYHVKLTGDGLFREEADRIMAAVASSPVGAAIDVRSCAAPPDPTLVTDLVVDADRARQVYADWYVREKLARRAAEKIREARAELAHCGLLGIPVGRVLDDLVPCLTIDVSAIMELFKVADWLVAEAERERMRAQAILRTYGLPVL